MTYWKLGCRWYSKSPLFFDFLVENKIVVSWTDSKFEINDIVLLTDGYKAIGIAKVLSTPTSILKLPQFHNDFDKLQIPTKEENLLIFKAEIFQLSSAEQFIYKLQKGIRKIQKLEIKTITKNLLEKKLMHNKMTNYTDLLHYKKQIILQGPPGTGKTRLAKEIALEMIKTSIDIDLKEFLKKGLSIPNASGAEEYYFLETVTANSVELSSERATKKWSASFNKIQEKLSQLQRGESPKNKGGDDPYVLAVAKYVFQKFKDSSNIVEYNEQVKLVQFHPSYTYEDFVRGIVSKPNEEGDGILYEAENKVLGAFAKKALENYRDHHADISTLNDRKIVEKHFFDFAEYIDSILEETGKPINLTENIGIETVYNDAFRYVGLTIGKTKNRMLFKDIIQAYLDGNNTRKDIKHNGNLSGLANAHSSYYIRVLNMFKKYIEDNKLSLIFKDQEKPDLKNYILVIDEINRANLSSVLGELIYALEYRNEAVESMYEVDGSNQLILPPNLYIIGTMNTADRSVGHIDYAIRRRFAFVEILPIELEDDDKIYFNLEGFEQVSKLFNTHNVSKEFEIKDVQIGHSYFIAKKSEAINEKERDQIFGMKMQFEVVPILEEYVKDGILINDFEGQKIKEYISSLKA